MKTTDNTTQLVHLDIGGSKISIIAAEADENNLLTIVAEESEKIFPNNVHIGHYAQCGKINEKDDVLFTLNKCVRLLSNSANIAENSDASMSLLPAGTRIRICTAETQIPSNGVAANVIDRLKNECRKRIENETIVVTEIVSAAYAIDGAESIEDPIGQKGNRIKAIFTMSVVPVEIKESILKMTEANSSKKGKKASKAITNIKINNMFFGMDALSVALLTDEERENGCAIINLGATTTTLGVYHKGKLIRLKVIPKGGLNVTKDISFEGISLAAAEKIKIHRGVALEKLAKKDGGVSVSSADNPANKIVISYQHLGEIIEARLKEILDPINEELQDVKTSLGAGVVLTGGGARMQGIVECVNEITWLETRIGNHSDWLSEETPDIFHAPEYAQAIGTLVLFSDTLNSGNSEAPSSGIHLRQSGFKWFAKVSDAVKGFVGELFRHDDIEKERNIEKMKENNEEV